MTVVDASIFVNALVVAGPLDDFARAEIRDLWVLDVPAIFGAVFANQAR